MSNKVLHLDSSNFNSTISADKPVLVDFWAPWCGPCKMLGPTIDALADEVGDSALICKVDVDVSPEIAQQYGVNAVPTIIFFRKGQRVGVCGMTTKEDLKNKLRQIS
ncbi:MAG: thioredoxin [Opitutales bacterium]|nr:thioredoxin [Opitutales bacterium]